MVTDSMTIIDYVAVIAVFLLSFVLLREILIYAPFSFSTTKSVIAFCMAIIIVLVNTEIINFGFFVIVGTVGLILVILALFLLLWLCRRREGKSVRERTEERLD